MIREAGIPLYYGAELCRMEYVIDSVEFAHDVGAGWRGEGVWVGMAVWAAVDGGLV